RHIKSAGPSPKRFPHGCVGIAAAVQPLLRTVVHARNTLQCKECGESECQLGIELAGVRRVVEVEPLPPVMIVQKRDEERARLAVRGHHLALGSLAPFIQVGELGWWMRRGVRVLDDAAESPLERKVERGIDTNRVAVLGLCVAADEMSQVVLVDRNLAKGEEVHFTYREPIL